MTVIAVKKDKNHTVKVDFDNSRSVRFDTDYWSTLCLKEGDTLTDERLTEYVKESEYIRAKSRGIWFLDRADSSEKSLYEKIVKGGISGEAAARAISRFKELGLLDDTRYAARMAERMRDSNISNREAYIKLLQKGIPKQTAVEALAETPFDESGQIEELLNKKYRLKLQAEGGAQKVYAALIRKGFSYGAVRDAIKKYTTELENYEEY